MTEDQIQRYQKSGITYFWCPKEYFPKFEEYLREDESVALLSEESLSDLAKTEEAAQVIDIVTAVDFTDEEKSLAIGEIGKKLITALAKIEAKDPKEVRAAIGKFKEITDDIIAIAIHSYETETSYETIEKIVAMDLEHSAAVASFSILFCLALGYSSAEILADVGLGALLHDLGLSQISPSLLKTSVSHLTQEQMVEFQSHVEKGFGVFKRSNVKLRGAVSEILLQHHEYSDGTGYPRHLKGSQISELAQIVGIADLLHELMTGRYDGIARSPADSFRYLGSLTRLKDQVYPYAYELIVTVIQTLERETGRSLQGGSK